MELRNGDNDILSRMQGNFPHIYDVYNDKTILYAMLSIFASKYNMTRDIIDRIYGMIGIETTYDEDLEHRWGSMLGIYKEVDESYDDYRARLMMVYISFSGGTKEAIKYAVAISCGIGTDKNIIDKYIDITDAWDYDHTITDTSHTYDAITNSTKHTLNNNFILNKPYDIRKDGAFICTIDLSIDENIYYYKDKILEAINSTRASGIRPYLVFLYISDDIVNMYRDADVDNIHINESCDDTGDMINNLDIMSDNIVINDDTDNCNISIRSNIWDDGYGCTNTTMITNRYKNADHYSDIIHSVLYDMSDTKIIEASNDNISIDDDDTVHVYNNDDKLADTIQHTIREVSKMRCTYSNEWSMNGLNANTVLNKNFMTNMLAETDAFSDIIIKGGIRYAVQG